MSDNADQATISPNFPTAVVEANIDKLKELNVDNYLDKDGTMYLYCEDGMYDTDELTALLQKMLTEAKMDYCAIEGCFYCTKMLPGEFGGFALFVTPDDVQHINTGSWVNRQENKFKRKKEGVMSIEDALNIVYQLAEQGSLSQSEAREHNLSEEAGRQQEALAVVHDMIVNEYEEG
jgi:hypothetical protein